jgi:hypothetical protein
MLASGMVLELQRALNGGRRDLKLRPTTVIVP